MAARKKTPSRKPKGSRKSESSPWPQRGPKKESKRDQKRDPKREPKREPRRQRDGEPRREPGASHSQRYGNPEAKSRSGKDQLVLRNLRALEEYLQHKPEALLSLEAAPALAETIAKRCHELGSGYNVAKIRTSQALMGEEDQLRAVIASPVGSERDLDDHLAAGCQTVLVLDHIKDPRNFGAIARSCGFFGVDAIVIPNKRQVGVTQIVVDTAMGAFAKLSVFQVPNLTRVLKTLKEAEFWVVGTALSGDSLTPKSLGFAKTALVIGAEDSGISPLIEKTCDLCLRIEGAEGGIDSLNVSVATGIFLQALRTGQSGNTGGS